MGSKSLQNEPIPLHFEANLYKMKRVLPATVPAISFCCTRRERREDGRQRHLFRSRHDITTTGSRTPRHPSAPRLRPDCARLFDCINPDNAQKKTRLIFRLNFFGCNPVITQIWSNIAILCPNIANFRPEIEFLSPVIDQ